MLFKTREVLRKKVSASWIAFASKFTIYNFDVQKSVKNCELVFCISFGLWVGHIISFVTDYLFRNIYSLVRDVVDLCRTGVATIITFELVLVYKFVIVPSLAVVVSIYDSFSFKAIIHIDKQNS